MAAPNPVVIDISHHQPDPVDWAALKANGVIGVIHKATEGTSYVDDKLFSRAKAAYTAGLKWSTYHFFRASDPQTQMKHYLDTVNPQQGERVVIDHEMGSDGLNPSLADLKRAAQYIFDTRPDLQITIYSGNLIKEQLGSKKDDWLAEHTSLWIAHYTSNAAPTWPTATWPQWSLWQYTDKGTAVGIKGSIDANRWNGDPAALGDWFGPSTAVTPAPTPEPTPVTGEILIEVTAPAGITVKVKVNGE